MQKKGANSDYATLRQNLTSLGFDEDDKTIYFADTQSLDKQVIFQIEIAQKFGATAVFLRKQLTGSYKPQAYIYDFTDGRIVAEAELANIQKKIWSSGEAPMACIFYPTEIKIINCSTHIKDNNTPEYLAESIDVLHNTHKIYNKQFAVKIKSGIFWDNLDVASKFTFINRSAYDLLIGHIRKIKKHFKETNPKDEKIINQLIIQSILIKYLEERVDSDGNRLFTRKYFAKYDNAGNFTAVLRNGNIVNLLEDLNDKKRGLNGNVFEWNDDDKKKIQKIKLDYLADALDADKTVGGQGNLFSWRYYEFSLIPIELISRLYEEFLEKEKKDKGAYYTPAHLAKLLVDEAMPLSNFKKVNLAEYKIIDPACGSGIFLVFAYKRLVQWWKLQNDFADPDIDVLKQLLENCIYGVDLNPQAARLAAFSLCVALCNELTPVQIVTKLKFPPLIGRNIINEDFFTCSAFQKESFDLVIGNPPFKRGGIKGYENNTWQIGNECINIPNNQISLKFVADSFQYLKKDALQCLIIKAAHLIYNSGSREIKEAIFSNLNVVQILDFTPLARNATLWENDAEVDSAAIFIKNQKPDKTRNILHAIFRRTKAVKERIVFELDEYDLNYVNRHDAVENNFIWKSNLLGGGRIKTLLDKLSDNQTLGEYFTEQNILCLEGIGGPKSLRNEAFTDDGIDITTLPLGYYESFNGKKESRIFNAPNLLIKKNIDIPFCINRATIPFSNETIGVYTKDISKIRLLNDYLIANHELLKFFTIVTSGKMLVYKNTAFKKEDIMEWPFNGIKSISDSLTEIDLNIINDVNGLLQNFMREGENSRALDRIKNNFKSTITHYGTEFSRAINIVYAKGKKKYRLSDVVELCDGDFIASVFRYDNKNSKTEFHKNASGINLKDVSDHGVSAHLTFKRTIRLYPEQDTVVFIKPNQYRYWLSLIAYRDADKYFAELSKQGY